MELDSLTELLQAFSYPAVFGLLAASGVGAPVSEELVLLAGGLLASKGSLSLPAMMAVAYLGLLVGDSLLYRIGRSLGTRALKSPRLKSVLTPSRVERVQGHFRQRGALTIAVARFTPGLRAPTFLIAGMSGLPYRSFLLADALAATVNTAVLTYLGFRFGSSALRRVQDASGWIFAGVLAVIVAFGVVKWLRRRRRLASGLPDAAARKLG